MFLISEFYLFTKDDHDDHKVETYVINLCLYMYIFWFYSVLRLPISSFQPLLSSQFPGCRFLSEMALCIPPIQINLSLPLRLFSVGVHFNITFGSYSLSILFTWSYQINCRHCILSIMVVSTFIIFIIRSFFTLFILDLSTDLLQKSISNARSHRSKFLVICQVSHPHNNILLKTALYSRFPFARNVFGSQNRVQTFYDLPIFLEFSVQFHFLFVRYLRSQVLLLRVPIVSPSPKFRFPVPIQHTNI